MTTVRTARAGIVAAWTGAVAAGGVAARPLAAQPDCFPPPTSNEARTLALTALPLVFAGAEAPGAAAGRVRLALEVTYLPRVDASIATPTLCRPGKGPENAAPLPVFPRPRLALRMPGSLVGEVSWVPPVAVAGVRSNLVGLALAHERPLRGSVVVRVRGHATLGSVEAPVTCPTKSLDDSGSECFGGERSRDRLRPNLAGLEAAVGWSQHSLRLRPYVGAGYTWLRPRFRVHFTNRAGETDRSRVEVDLERVALFGGATWRASGPVLLSAELYGAPRDGVTGRVLVSTDLPFHARRTE